MAMRRWTPSFYVDLGTANTMVYQRGAGFLLKQPSVLAYENRGSGWKAFSAGQPAKRMLGKAPLKINVERPLREGVIADFSSTAQMLQQFFQKIRENRFFYKPNLVISLPCKVSNFEADAVKAVGRDLGAGSVYLIDEPVAAAVGAGIPFFSRKSHGVLDLGGGTSELVVLSCGGIVAADALRKGGEHIDHALIDYIRLHMNFLIGEQTAEELKWRLASAVEPTPVEDRTWVVKGLDLEKGLPGSLEISSRFIYPAVNSVLKPILEMVHHGLQALPPEVSADLAETGLVLVGGGSLLKNMDLRLEQEFGLRCRRASQPMEAVAEGGARAIEDYKLLDRIAK